MGPEDLKLFFSDGLLPHDGSLERLNEIVRIEEIDKGIAVLPEVHYKKDYPVPTGIVVASQDYIFPTFIALVVNCGMRVIKTHLTKADLNERLIDKIYQRLMDYVPIKIPRSPCLADSSVEEIFLTGASWAIKEFGLEQEETMFIENQGSMFSNQELADKKEILKAVPPVCFKLAQYGLNYMGGGGHFIEMQVVDHLFSPQIAQKLGLFKGQIVFMLHSDAGPAGGMVSQYFGYNRIPSLLINRLKFNCLKWKYHLNLLNFWQIPQLRKRVFLKSDSPGIAADSPLGRRYILASYAVANFGYVKRMALTQSLRKAIKEALRKKSLKLDLLCDLSHNLIQKENQQGQDMWIHRHGCCRCLPPGKIENQPLYNQTGQPFALPSSMGTPSYICVAAQGSKESFYSTCHGTGKRSDGLESKIDESSILKYMKQNDIHLYRRGGKAKITRYAPQSFNDPETIIKSLEEFDIANPIAKVLPLAVLKE